MDDVYAENVNVALVLTCKIASLAQSSVQGCCNSQEVEERGHSTMTMVRVYHRSLRCVGNAIDERHDELGKRK